MSATASERDNGSSGVTADAFTPTSDPSGGPGGGTAPPQFVKELNDQLLRAWDIYIKFFTVFLTVNIAALGLVVEKTDPGSAARWVVGLTFLVQNVIAFITGMAMAQYTRDAAASLKSHGAQVLARFGALGTWGGIGNAIGNGVIGLTWVVVIFIG